MGSRNYFRIIFRLELYCDCPLQCLQMAESDPAPLITCAVTGQYPGALPIIQFAPGLARPWEEIDSSGLAGTSPSGVCCSALHLLKSGLVSHTVQNNRELERICLFVHH